MNVKYEKFVVGTAKRPTLFLIKSGELVEDVEDAELFDTFDEACVEIEKCDNPKLFVVYTANINVVGV